MAKKNYTLDELAMMLEVGFDEVTTVTKDEIDGLREELMDFGYNVNDSFEKLAAKFRLISERLNTQDREIGELRRRVNQTEKSKRSARGSR